MNKYIQKKLVTLLSNESHEIFHQDEKISEKIDRMDTILNMTKIIQNYDELKPVLEKFFREKIQDEKWER
jgi:hypothetical protein